MLPTFVFIVTLLVAVAEFLLAGIVFIKHPASAYHRVAASRSLAMGTFALFSIFFYFSPNFETAALWNRIRAFPLIFLPTLTLLFTWYWAFKKRDLTWRILHATLVGSTFIFLAAACFTIILGYPAHGAFTPWISIPTSESMWPMLFAGWAIIQVIFAIILSVFHYAGLKDAADKRFQLLILLGLPFVAIPAVIFGLLPSNYFPDFLVHLPVWVVCSDILIAIGLTSRQFFDPSFSLAYQPVLQTIKEGVVVVNYDSSISFANSAFCSLVNKTESELVGRPLLQFFQPNQSGLERIVKGTITAESPETHGEFQLASGKSIFVSLSTSPIEFQGRRRGLAIIFSDYAAQKDAERKMEALDSEINLKYARDQVDWESNNVRLDKALVQAELARQQLQHRVFELESLANLSSQLRTSRSITEMLHILLVETVRILEADAGIIFLKVGGGLAAKSFVGISGEVEEEYLIPKNDPLWDAFESDDPVTFISYKDKAADSTLFINGMLSAAACPLHADARKLGLLVVSFKSEENLAEKNRELLTSVGNIASNALFRSNTLESLEQSILNRNRELEMLYRIASICAETPETYSMVNQVLQVLLDTFSARVAVVYLDQLQLSLFIGARPLMYLAEISAELKAIPLESSLWQFVYQANQPMLAVSLDDDTRLDVRIVTELIPLGRCTMIAAPVCGSGKPLGAVCLFRDALNPFAPEDLTLLNTASRQFAARVEVNQLVSVSQTIPQLFEPSEIIREIYDGLEGVLTYQYQVTQTSRQMVLAGERQSFLPTLDQISQLSHQALKNIRLLMYLNCPPEIETIGLANAIQRRLELVEQPANVKTTMTGDYNYHLPGSLEIGLFQAVQEVLNYLILRGGETAVNVKIESDFNSIILEISCNDFVSDPAQQNRLAGVQQHVEALGGKLTTFIAVDNGLTIRIQV